MTLNDSGLPLPVLIDEPREAATWVFCCHAPMDVLAPLYDDIKPENQKIIEARSGIPCEGGGVPGPWCCENVLRPCPWEKHRDYDEDIGI